MNKVISVDEFIQRLGMHPIGNIWSVLITNTVNKELIEELKDAITIFVECEINVISGQQKI